MLATPSASTLLLLLVIAFVAVAAGAKLIHCGHKRMCEMEKHDKGHAA